MTVACFSPSVLTCDYDLSSINSVEENLSNWFFELKKNKIDIYFTQDYVALLFQKEWPWNDSKLNKRISELKELIARGARSSVNGNQIYCSCEYSNIAWNNLLYSAFVQYNKVGVIASCNQTTINGNHICHCIDDFLRLEYPWLNEIDDIHKDKIPIVGTEISYIPDVKWDVLGLKEYWHEIDKNGYKDVDGQLWVWQEEEGGHWDVTKKKSQKYIRVGKDGTIIDQKFRR